MVLDGYLMQLNESRKPTQNLVVPIVRLTGRKAVNEDSADEATFEALLATRLVALGSSFVTLVATAETSLAIS